MKSIAPFRVALLVSVMVLISSVASGQPDLHRWMPNVGDKFVFSNSGVSQEPWLFTPELYKESAWSDTISETILDINYYFDSTHPSVIRVQKNWSHGDQVVYYQFLSTTDSLMLGHPFEVRTGDVDLPNEYNGTFGTDYDFTNSTDSQMIFMGSAIRVLASQRGGHATYSSNFHWFIAQSGSQLWFTYYQTLFEWFDRQLISATNSNSLVPLNGQFDNTHFVLSGAACDNGLLAFSFSGASSSFECQLLDPLARPIRSWSLDVAAGESQVHLNVANVPSGVYFLRVSAPGVEEVRKVVIVH